MTMSYAWLAFLAGLTIYVCTPFIRGMPWQDRSKVGNWRSLEIIPADL